MKEKNKLKFGVILGTFLALIHLTNTSAKASGAYGSGTVLADIDDLEIHETVDAGIEGIIPQVVMTITALSGLATTSFLIKKTK